jgi:hypothetical protein
MTFTTPDPVPSGQDLAVVAVRGRTPRILQDFVGDAVFTVQWRDQDLLVAGIGTLVGSGVRFHEKDAGNGGKDVRVWSITSSTPPGLFFASISARHLLSPVAAGPSTAG